MPQASKIFDPISMEEFRDAVKARNGIAVIDGKIFLFDYTAATVYFKPKYGYAPSGWVEISRIEKGEDI